MTQSTPSDTPRVSHASSATRECAQKSNSKSSPLVDRARYRHVRRFFMGVLIHALWWDLIMSLPLLRKFRKEPMIRWLEITRRYRRMAVEMGGVLIKLGQFLSARVDILPFDITTELSGLQDEVPPENASAITAQIEMDFGCPLSEIFEWFSPEPLGAASLAQVHEVRTHSGETFVVKVLRPGIHKLVETDLAALAQATRWLSIYRPLGKRVNLQYLTDEFATVTRKELDLNAEAHHIERFSETFKNDPTVYIPKVHWPYCAGRTLALENVEYIKIADTAAITAAGISTARVADALYDIYMKQVFETHFVHVDPHPGNLFVMPLPYPAKNQETTDKIDPDESIPTDDGRPFRIVFVDFGMMTTISPRMHAAMREYVIGVGTRDAHKIVQSYLKAGVLLKGANLVLAEEAHEALFDRFWGTNVGDLRDVAFHEAAYFWKEYRDVIFSQSFQIPVDLLFTFRAVGILAGLATHLDPQFDPWNKAIPYAERYALDEFKQGVKSWRHEIQTIGQVMYKMPRQMERVLARAQQGNLSVQTALNPAARKTIRDLERSVKKLSLMVMAAALLIAGVILFVAGPNPRVGWFCGGLSFLFFIWAIRR